MNLRKRLRKIEEALRPVAASCPACLHRRGLVALVTSELLPDGTESPISEDGLPPPCDVCGQVPEVILHIMEKVVQSREDLTP